MKRWKTGFALAVAGLALGGGAHAAALYTAPARAGAAGEIMLCDAANVGGTPVIMTIEVRDYAGGIVGSTVPFHLGPGQFATKDSTDVSAAYCKFTVIGNSRKIRAQAIYTYNNGARTIAVPAK